MSMVSQQAHLTPDKYLSFQKTATITEMIMSLEEASYQSINKPSVITQNITFIRARQQVWNQLDKDD